MNVKITRTGQWAQAGHALRRSVGRVRGAMDRAVRQEAQMFRKAVVQGIRDQSPGGRAFKPLAATTLATRAIIGFKGTKALIRSGELRNAVAVVEVHPGEIFVGVRRSAQGKDGRSLVNLAEIHEFGFGPITIPVTDAMHRFLMAAFAKAGIKTAEATGGGRKRFVVVTIPARPFMQPPFDELFGNPEKVRARVAARMARELLGVLGRAVVSVPER